MQTALPPVPRTALRVGKPAPESLLRSTLTLMLELPDIGSYRLLGKRVLVGLTFLETKGSDQLGLCRIWSARGSQLAKASRLCPWRCPSRCCWSVLGLIRAGLQSYCLLSVSAGVPWLVVGFFACRSVSAGVPWLAAGLLLVVGRLSRGSGSASACRRLGWACPKGLPSWHWLSRGFGSALASPTTGLGLSKGSLP